MSAISFIGLIRYMTAYMVSISTSQAGRCAGEGAAGPISDTLCHSQCGRPALCSPLHYR